MEFEKLQSIISGVLGIEADDITPESVFVSELGADSLDISQIIMEIEKEFDIEISNEAAEGIVTVRDAVDKIRNALD